MKQTRVLGGLLGFFCIFCTFLHAQTAPSTYSAYTASYLGVTGQDYVGPYGQLTPDGVPDWHIQLQGLRGTPVKVQITSTAGGVWQTPYNGYWLILSQYGASGSGDLWFEPWSTPGFHVKVWYSDSTTDEADATATATPPPVTSTLKASYLGAPGQDYVGPYSQLTPDGVPDWHIQLQGLRGTPVKVQITSTAGGVWQTPYNGYWLILAQYGASGSGDFWFEPASTPGFHVKVWYSDSTTDEADATATATQPPVTSTLKASYLGATGQDYVGPYGQLTPDGVPDWHIQLQGLRGTPVKVQITSTAGGVWQTPYNGYWLILAQYGASGSGDLWFEPASTPGFHVKVWYSDSTTDEVDATATATQLPVTSTLKASFLGATGPDYVGPYGQLTPDGVPDWHIQLQGLRGTPVKVQITSTAGGVWQTPYNGYWLILAQYGASGSGDLWFEPSSTPGFHVKVWYSDSTTDEADPTTTPSSPSRLLTWSPPTCGDAIHSCVDLNLYNTGSHQNPSLNPNTDYRLHLPATGPLVGGLTISGGHNVQIIGGEIDLSYPCSDASSACHGINISRGSASGIVYIEGVYIKNPDPNYLTDRVTTGDGIDVDDYPGVTDVVLQNVRIEGIKGCDPNVPAAHADVFQPYNAGLANYYVDHLTGTTDCQGMQVDPDYAYATYGLLPKSGTFKNVNINVFANPALGNSNRYAWWLTYGTSLCLSFPITLSNVYVSEPDGTLKDNAVWPDPSNNYPAGCLGLYPGGYATWPTLTTLNGSITNGSPAGGDYVPAGSAGIGYITPR